MDSVKSENYFENYDHKIEGMGHIESDNQSSLYGWFMLYIVRLELSESNEVREKYGFILGLKELFLKSSSQTNTKKSKQTNKKKEKNQNQAYTRVEVDLDDS